jgi:hypothetical protein
MFKIYFLAVTSRIVGTSYGIAFLIIGVYLRKLVVNGDFIFCFFTTNTKLVAL